MLKAEGVQVFLNANVLLPTSQFPSIASRGKPEYLQHHCQFIPQE
jgi:hypothetical protein